MGIIIYALWAGLRINEIMYSRPYEVIAGAGCMVAALDSLSTLPKKLDLLVLCQEYFHKHQVSSYQLPGSPPGT